MQAEYVSTGRAIDYTPVGAKTAGDVVALGTGRIGIVINDILAGILGALAVAGVYRIAKINGAINLWAFLYWDEDANPQGGVAGTGGLTATDTGNIPAGICIAAAGATDEKVLTLLFEAPAIANTIRQPLTQSIEDPGDAGAIPVTDSGEVQIVTLGAETRTLAAPTYAGQLLLISMKTDGGDCVIAIATTVNQTGNNRITLNDAGDAVLLVAKVSGSTKRWSVVSNDGASLSTV